MDKDFADKLKGFDKVWRRVQQAKGKGQNKAARPYAPQRGKGTPRPRRFDPGGRF